MALYLTEAVACCGKGTPPEGRLFQGLSDRWKGRCLVGLWREGEAGLPQVGGGNPGLEAPMFCCSCSWTCRQSGHRSFAYILYLLS